MSGKIPKLLWVLCRLVDDLALVVCLLRDDYCVGVFLPYLQFTGQHGVHLSCGYFACSLFFSLPSWEICTVSIGVSSADQLSRTCGVCAPQLVHCIFSCSCSRLSLCFCYSEVPPIQWDRSYCWVLVVAFWSIDTFSSFSCDTAYHCSPVVEVSHSMRWPLRRL